MLCCFNFAPLLPTRQWHLSHCVTTLFLLCWVLIRVKVKENQPYCYATICIILPPNLSGFSCERRRWFSHTSGFLPTSTWDPKRKGNSLISFVFGIKILGGSESHRHLIRVLFLVTSLDFSFKLQC